jgi:hypothetical protein
MDAKRWAVVAVWAGTTVAAVAIDAAVQGPFVFTALALTVAVAVVVGMIVQLAVGEQDGFVGRLVASVCGSFGVVVLAALVRLVVGA